MIAVEWFDAADGEAKAGKYETLEPEDFCVIRTSYGKLLKENNKAILLARTIDADGDIEYTAIPKRMILRKTEYVDGKPKKNIKGNSK